MSNCNHKILGYHSNDKPRCLRFVNDNEPIIDAKDKYWLGEGMYFWDNYSNAQYWKNKKDRDNSQQEHLITKADICVDRLFDLKDDEKYKIFEKLWSAFKSKVGDKIKKDFIGVQIDLLHKAYLYEHFDVYKGEGYYLYKGEKEPQNAKLTSKTRTIYNVKNYECISNSATRLKLDKFCIFE